MDTFSKLKAPAGEKIRQIQRMVHDLRKNDGGLMQKIKRFPNDQVTLFYKSGKDTWDRITNRNPPNVPHRDYKENDDDDDSEEEFSDFEDYEDPNVNSDSETYAVPSEENDDDHYEPPPTDHENIQQPIHFSPANGGYADKKPQRQLPNVPSTGINKPTRPFPKPNQTLTRTSQPSLPPPPSTRPLPPPQSLPKPTPNKPFSKPQPGPRPQVNLPPHPGKKKTYPKEPIDTNDDEEDYIVPHDDDDNYIEPTQDRLAYKPPEVNRANKPTSRSPKPPSYPIHDEEGQELYEVPENEAKPSPPLKRDKLPAPRRNSPPKIEQHNDQEFQSSTEPFQNNYPSPVPRMNKTKPPIILQKPSLPSRDTNSNIDKPLAHERPRQPSFGSEVNTSTHQPKFPSLTPASKPNFAQRPPEVSNRFLAPSNRSNIPRAAEQEAGVVNKGWYASSCDRKTAEDALQSSCKDGSFLIRKSSGQDSKQPYTLVVFYNRRVYNIPVRYIESSRQYALGREKSGEERFNSVAEMIENHQRTPLVLIDSQNNTKDSTKLKFPVNIP